MSQMSPADQIRLKVARCQEVYNVLKTIIEATIEPSPERVDALGGLDSAFARIVGVIRSEPPEGVS